MIGKTDSEERRDAALRARAREARHQHGPTWTPSTVVTVAKCQGHVAGCPNTVEVTEEGMGALQSFSAQLERGEEPAMSINECFPCPTCREIRVSAAEVRSSDRRAKTSEAIRYVKQAGLVDLEIAWSHVRGGGRADQFHPTTPPAITEAAWRLANLRKWHGEGHVNDMLSAIREARGGKKQRESL